MKKAIKRIVGYENEYTKREMALFTRVVLFLLLFIPVMFFVLFVSHMDFGLAGNIVKTFWQYYLTFCRWLITAYSVAWIGQMGKAFLSKREEENNKLKKQLAEMKGDGEDEH